MKQSTKTERRTVRQLDIERYLGRWYEIARYDNCFERGMDNVTADYSLREDGKVSVVNSGWKDGKKHVSYGKAKQPDPYGTPGRLRVSFFLFFYSDYDILLLDEEYRYVLVGSKSDKYLWILARTPVLPESTVANIVSEAQKRGYDTSRLIKVNQSRNL